APQRPILEEFVETAIRDWRQNAGNINVARTLLPALPDAGLKLIEARPIIFAATPKDFVWQWPKTFIVPHARRLAERDVVTSQWADDVEREWDEAEKDPRSIMTTPLLMEIVAERT
ncbi:MAG: hypothetical protein ACOZAA_03300, partial [Pseudomonadota bacterium]